MKHKSYFKGMIWIFLCKPTEKYTHKWIKVKDIYIYWHLEEEPEKDNILDSFAENKMFSTHI